MPEPFDEEHAASYDDRFAKLAPFRDALHLATRIALTELPAEAHILCVGAGTGAEVLDLARAFPRWRFTALDTSTPMLSRCRVRVNDAGLRDRVRFHEGDIHGLPADAGPFHGATAILVSQFLVEPDRRRCFFRSIAERLPAKAPLVFADLAADELDGELMQLWKGVWRFAGAPEENIEGMAKSFGRMVSVVAPQEVERLVVSGGFDAPTRIFQTVFIHGWLARRTG